MIDALSIWKSTFAALPSVSDGTWTTNFSDWVDARVTAKAQVTNVTHSVTPFTFSKATFKAQLDLLVISTNRNTAATNFANAWEAAINASLLVTQVGDYINPGGAANTWGTIYTSLIDSSSITASKAQLITDVNNASNVLDIDNSELPEILRNSFLALTCSITGLDSVVPPGGPNPLNLSGAAMI